MLKKLQKIWKIKIDILYLQQIINHTPPKGGYKKIKNMANLELFKQSGWYWKKHDARKKIFRGITKQEWEIACRKKVDRLLYNEDEEDTRSPLRKAYEAIKEWAKPEHGNYQKIAIYGHTHLYLCSPVYGHADYNKSRLLPIKGNEDKCEWLIAISDRIANQN